MQPENKKQLFIIVAAAAAGLVAVFMMSAYVKNSVDGQTKALAEKFELSQKQKLAEAQQRSDQQKAMLAQAIERIKSEDAAAMQKQMSVIQKQEQEARMRQAVAQPIKLRKPSLALKTPVGKRAVTVMIESLAAVGGLINAGDFVDVIAQLNVPSQEADKKTVTAMVFQNLQVLAVNTNLDDPGAYDEQQAGTLKITFAVNPQEAGLLSFANKNGTLELALRSPDESKRLKVKASTWKTLTDYVLKNQGFDIQNPDEDKNNKQVEAKPSIQIFRGGKEL